MLINMCIFVSYQSFKTLKEVKVACIRRSLVFPLYRHWELSQEVVKDTVNILKSGENFIYFLFLFLKFLFILALD